MWNGRRPPRSLSLPMQVSTSTVRSGAFTTKVWTLWSRRPSASRKCGASQARWRSRPSGVADGNSHVGRVGPEVSTTAPTRRRPTTRSRMVADCITAKPQRRGRRAIVYTPGRMGPLSGVRVVDCTTVVLGPWAAQQLGDLGADVVKVEPPEGDTTRQLGPMRNPGMGAFYLAVNRNKRSIVLDLKQEAARGVLLRLAEGADVLLHNYRPQAARRLGMSYETFRAVNPGIVYKRILNPNRRPFKTKDGYLAILPYTDQNWRDFFTLVGRQDLLDDPRYKTLATRLRHIEGLYEELAKLALTRTNAEWLAELDRRNIPAMSVNTLESLLHDPHLEAVGFWQTVEHPSEGTLRLPGIPVTYGKTPGAIRRLPPRLGEHSLEILREAGLSAAEITALVASGATRAAG